MAAVSGGGGQLSSRNTNKADSPTSWPGPGFSSGNKEVMIGWDPHQTVKAGL